MRENAMNIRARLLAGLMGSALLAGSAIAATSDTSLVTAARQGDRTAVESVLKTLTKQDLAGQQGTAALTWAATHNDLAMADLLLKAGADAKAANEFGASSLYAAAEHADPAMTQKLLAAGADPNVALPSGETPLMLAASRGNVNTVAALLKGGANPNAKESNAGQNALMWALSERQAAVVDELIKGGADVNAGSKTGFAPLMFAAQQNDVASASLLLKAGAKIDAAQPKTVLTALMIASAMSSPQSVALLLENKADPNIVDSTGQTALHKAVRDSDYGANLAGKDRILATVKSLLKHGANPNARLNPDEATAAAELVPYQIANQNDRRRVASTINEVSLKGATPIALAAEVNNLDVIKALVDAGGNPLVGTEQGTTPLILAAGGGTDIQRMREPAERAIAVETVKYLVEKGADVNAAGQYGWTAMHAAAYQGLNDVIEYLASKGASVNEMDAFGQTPLSISMSVLTQDIGARRPQIPRRFRGDVAQLLLKLGATPLDKSGVVVVLQRSGDLDLGRSGGDQ
jgi:ankyrin repeat protein